MKNFCTFFLFLLTAIGLKAQSVTVQGTGNFELTTALKNDSIVIPLKLDNIQYKDLQFRGNKPFTVRLVNRGSKSFKDAISFAKDPLQPALNVEVDLNKLTAAGTYEVSLLYFTPANPQNSLLTFSLIRPPAVLELLKTVTITKEGSDVYSDPLVIQEIGNRSGIKSLRLNSPYIMGINRGELVKFSSSPYRIEAGNILKAQYKVNNDLLSKVPLGEKITGKMQIYSEEMATPLSVSFEVLRKRDKGWIIVAVLLGLVIGHFVRHYLKKQREWEEAKIKGFQLMEEMIASTNNIQDSNFIDAITVLANQLKLELEKRNGILPQQSASSLTAAIAEIIPKFNARKEAFRIQMEQQKSDFVKLARSLNNTDLLETIQIRLKKAKDRQEKAKIELDNFNPTKAAESLFDVILAIREALERYSSYVGTIISFINKEEIYPANTKPVIKEAVTNLKQKIQVSLDNLKKDPADAQEATSSVLEANRIQEQLNRLHKTLHESIMHHYQIIDSAATENPNFKTAFNQWSDAILELILNKKEEEYAENIWEPNILTQLEDTWNLLQGPRRLGDNVPQGGNINISEQDIAESRINLQDYHFKDIRLGYTYVQAALSTSWQRWLLFTALQVIFLTALLGLGAYKVYGPSFIGTWNELITIFLLAFSLEITVDNVLQLRDKTA